MTIVQVITARRNVDTDAWEQGPEITLVPSMVVGVGENDDHAIIYTPAGQFYVWPNKTAVDNFLTTA